VLLPADSVSILGMTRLYIPTIYFLFQDDEAHTDQDCEDVTACKSDQFLVTPATATR